MKLETIAVYHPSGKGKMIINKEEFDESVHTIFDQDAEEPQLEGDQTELPDFDQDAEELQSEKSQQEDSTELPDFDSMKVREIKKFAENERITLSGDAKSKADLLDEIKMKYAEKLAFQE